jgi:hypothetical protein
MRRRPRNKVLGAIVCCCFAICGCATSSRYNEVPLGVKSQEVLELLGKPHSTTRSIKPPSTVVYFGEKPSATYLALPDGAVVETWSYCHFLEIWSYVFSLEEPTPTLVDKLYYHRVVTPMIQY